MCGGQGGGEGATRERCHQHGSRLMGAVRGVGSFLPVFSFLKGRKLGRIWCRPSPTLFWFGASSVAELRMWPREDAWGTGGGGVDWCWAQTFEVDPEAFGVGVSGAHVT